MAGRFPSTPEAPLLPSSAYWIRTLKPWLGAQVVIGLRSGAVETGRLVDVEEDGPTLEVGESRRRVCGWQDVQSVEVTGND